MKIMAFDTTAKIASVAVLENEHVLASYSIDNGLTQSELVLPMAEDILKKLGLGFSDIDLYAASTGPGSFTGVRIGVSLIKGLAFSRNIPCISVSTLDALTENISPLQGILVPCMDARRAQVYSAIYKSDGVSVEKLTPDRAIALSSLASELGAFSNEKIYICGDGYSVAREALSEMGLKIERTPHILINENASSVGRVAYKMFERGEITSDLEISPSYLRRPQAERELLERQQNQTQKEQK